MIFERRLLGKLLVGLGFVLMLSQCTVAPQILCEFSDDKQPKFDFKELAEKARFARMAYWDSARIWEEYDSLYNITLLDMPQTAGQAVLLMDSAKSQQIVAIRGTVVEQWRSILTDAQYTKTPDEKLGIYVHKGFYKATQELYGGILPLLDKDVPVSITGHSLGGALAVMLSYYLTVDGYKLNQTITFGQPKITNRDGVEKFRDVNLLRVVNGSDPVAFVPPLSFVTAIDAPYQHAGGALVLEDSSSYHYVCEEAANVTFVTEFWRDVVGKEDGVKNAFLGNLPQHRDKHYINNIEKQIAE